MYQSILLFLLFRAPSQCVKYFTGTKGIKPHCEDRILEISLHCFKFTLAESRWKVQELWRSTHILA